MLTQAELDELVALRRVRDHMDRHFAQPLRVVELARLAHQSPAHFARRFRATYGEPPHRYLMTRRLERAATMRASGSSVTDAAMAVGWRSLGSFSQRFTEVYRCPPSSYRSGSIDHRRTLPSCLAMVANRPHRVSTQPLRSSSIGEATRQPSA